MIKNPAIKSLAQLQGFAAAAGAFAGIVPNRLFVVFYCRND